jgi:Flp pilus assembly pilin Flp
MQLLTAVVVRAQNAWFAARDKESGQTLVEYALIISLVALACVLALGFLSGKIQDLFSRTGSSLG